MSMFTPAQRRELQRREAIRQQSDALRAQLTPLIQRLAADTLDLPHKEAAHAITAALAKAGPTIPRGVRRHLGLSRAVWEARSQLWRAARVRAGRHSPHQH